MLEHEYELNSYRFSSWIELSEEMLSFLMEEAVDEANIRRKRTNQEFFENLIQQAKGVPNDESVVTDVEDEKVSSRPSCRPFLIVVAGPNGSGKTTL